MCNTIILLDDDHYYELELHNSQINIPVILITHLLLPILVGIIVNYVSSKNVDVDSNVRIKIHVEKSGEIKEITYEGSINDFEDAINKSKQLFD